MVLSKIIKAMKILFANKHKKYHYTAAQWAHGHKDPRIASVIKRFHKKKYGKKRK